MLVIDPFHPKTHYELALSYNNMGNSKKAIKHMNIAVDIWKDADKDFSVADDARSQLEQWT